MATDPNYGKASWPSMGPYLFSGEFLNRMFGRVFQGGISRQDTITATAGGTKAAAFPLIKSWNNITVCASTHDSVLLPPAIAGSRVLVINSGAQTLDVYGKGTDTIDAVATGTANNILTTKLKEYTCITRGLWITTSILA